MHWSGRRVHVPALVLGFVVMQLAWILALPPYTGIDEIDHSYHAAAVARGDVGPKGAVEDGRGEFVTAPRDMVAAARSQCVALKYNGRDNCFPTRRGPDDTLLVGSAAARYNPVYYAVVGTIARPFHGDTANYVMRAVSATMCAIGMGAVGWCLLRRRRTPWVGAALLVALAPTLVYSTIVTAPNGLEMVAGLMMWAGLLVVGGRDVPGSRGALVVATVGAALLVTLRTLGPLFALTIAVVVIVSRRREVMAVLRSRTRAFVVATGVVLLALAASLAWILTLDPLGTTDIKHPSGYGPALARLLPSALLQAIAAFPSRTDHGPLFVYPVYMLLLAVLLVVGVRVAPRRLRGGLVLGIVLTQLLPFAVSLAGAPHVGVVWQGRYGLPFVAGVAVLAGLAWETGLAGVVRSWPKRREQAALLTLAGAWLLVQVACIVGLQHTEAGFVADGIIESPHWLRLPLPLEGVLALLGGALVVWALLRGGLPDVSPGSAQDVPQEA